MSNLSGIIKSIRNDMREDRGVSGDGQRIEQLGWMLFLKIFDDKDKELELLDDKYRSPIPDKFKWRNWAADDEGMTGDELLNFVDQQLYPTLKELPALDPRAFMVREVFEGNNNYMKSGINIRKVLNKLNEIDFNIASERHLFGELYETILQELQSAGDYGEFYTPRAITQFITDIINPKPDERILDPACGTGGFLTSAIEHLKKQVKNIDQRKNILKNIQGWEWKPLPYVLATTNLILHDVELPDINYRDALEKPLSEYHDKDRVNVIIANPPFGGTVANSNEKNFPQNYRTKESADLFLILMIHMLKRGGRAGIVLPDASLSGEGVKQRIRQKLLEDCNLHTIIRLPNSVFKPYATVPTNLLFFEKGKQTKEVWYYQHKYHAGVKSYSKTNPLKLEELEPIKKWWNKRVENEVSWKVPIDTIIERGYDLDIKNPHQKEENGEPLIEIIKEQKKAETDVIHKSQNLLEQLRKLNCQNEVNLIDKHFHVIQTIDKGIVQVKSFLLNLALRGKLTKQKHEDGNSLNLLQIIKAEKERLIIDKIIRKEKIQPSIKINEIPFSIPVSWQWCRIGEIAQHNSGKTLDSGRNTGQLREYITTSNLYWGYFNLEKLKSMPFEEAELNNCTAIKGDLLVCEGGEAGRAAIWKSDEGICFQNHIHRIRPYGNINSEFIYLNFLYLYLSGRINIYRKGMGITNISGKSLASIPIPLPPNPEQNRIVQKIGQLMQLCDELQQSIQQSKIENEKLLHAALRDALRKDEGNNEALLMAAEDVTKYETKEK
jgi:type I restriction enzyme M protein